MGEPSLDNQLSTKPRMPPLLLYQSPFSRRKTIGNELPSNVKRTRSERRFLFLFLIASLEPQEIN